MKKLLKVIPIVAMHLSMTLGICTAIINLYMDIVEPATVTRFEILMTYLVSISIADYIFQKVWKNKLAKEVKDYIDDGWDTK